jgi:hypothetical protein
MKNEEQTPKEPQIEALHIADVSCRAIWKKVPSQYLSITGLFIGKVKVASYCMDGCSSKDDSKKYVVNSTLPTIKDTIGRFETEEECKQVCIRVAKVFCEQLQHGS